jgi:hypothetical protein
LDVGIITACSACKLALARINASKRKLLLLASDSTKSAS